AGVGAHHAAENPLGQHHLGDGGAAGVAGEGRGALAVLEAALLPDPADLRPPLLGGAIAELHAEVAGGHGARLVLGALGLEPVVADVERARQRAGADAVAELGLAARSHRQPATGGVPGAGGGGRAGAVGLAVRGG